MEEDRFLPIFQEPSPFAAQASSHLAHAEDRRGSSLAALTSQAHPLLGTNHHHLLDRGQGAHDDPSVASQENGETVCLLLHHSFPPPPQAEGKNIFWFPKVDSKEPPDATSTCFSPLIVMVRFGLFPTATVC